MKLQELKGLLRAAKVLTLKLSRNNSPKDVHMMVSQYFVDNNINVELAPNAVFDFFKKAFPEDRGISRIRQMKACCNPADRNTANYI